MSAQRCQYRLFSNSTVTSNAFQTFSQIFRRCSDERALGPGKQAHCRIIVCGFNATVFVTNCLIQMYVKCRDLEYAVKVFDEMPERDTVSWNTMVFGYSGIGNMDTAKAFFDRIPRKDVVSWNSLISGYSKNGEHKESVRVCLRMRSFGVDFDPTSLALILKSCSTMEDFNLGAQVQCVAVKMGYDSDVVTASSMLDMYAKCKRLELSLRVFEEMRRKNWVTWSAVIAGCVYNDRLEKGLEFFKKMIGEGFGTSQSSYASVFRACGALCEYGIGTQLHGRSLKENFGRDVLVGTATLDMYGKLGFLSEASLVFDRIKEKDLVSWNAIIASSEHFADTMSRFVSMLRSGAEPDQFTFGSVLKACAGGAHGAEIHGRAVKSGMGSDPFVSGALADMYCKCGRVEEAERVHSRIPTMVSWNSIISGLSQQSRNEDAQRFFFKMLEAGVDPDSYTYAAVLDTCANLAAIGLGTQIHARVVKQRIHSDTYISSTLVDMYSKCGNLRDSRLVFEKARKRDPVTWNAMLCGYANHGFGEEAIRVFEDMKLANIEPNGATFVSVLRACSHIGDVEKGLHYFRSMQDDHGLAPNLDHYSCMVDIIGRSGQLDEALRLIRSMPFEPDAIIWRTMLGVCKLNGDVEMAEMAARNLLELEPDDSSCYVLLSNVYADSEMWDEMSRTRKAMRSNRLKKEPGCSWIEVKDEFHAFLVRDKAHPRCEEIYERLHLLIYDMRIGQFYEGSEAVESFWFSA